MEDERRLVTEPIPALRGVLERFEIDRAVTFGLLSRFWSFGAAPVTALLIATKFTPELQGYYYTFASLLALQVFVELGLGTVIVQFVSHEWANLSLDSDRGIVGDPASRRRLAAIARLSTRWYMIAAPIAATALIITGYIFFRNAPGLITWRLPWTALCLLTGLNLILAPIWSVLEGANQVRTVYAYRFVEGVVTSTTLWVAMVSGAGLWTTVISGFATLAVGLFFLRAKYWRFVQTVLAAPTDGVAISWTGDLLPMQWRIAISWLSGYFIFSFFTPILFKYHGPALAGQMGMTWNMVTVIGLIPGTWLSPKVPQFGMLISQRKYEELDRLFWKVTKIMAGLALVLGFCAWSLVWILYHFQFSLATRLLSPLPTGLLIAAQIAMVSSLTASAYMRAHKKEPLAFLSLFTAILIGASNLVFGKRYGATGMAAGYFAVTILVIPFVFVAWGKLRKKWHAPAAELPIGAEGAQPV